MNFDKVIIKQIPDDYAAMTGLHKYGRSKMPKTFEFLQVGLGPDGRALTGIDEEAYSVNSIADPEAREKKKEELLALRLSLQKLTQKDLSATSNYWDSFGIHLSSDSDLILNKNNPQHVIIYHAMIANGYAAPDYASASHPHYRNAKYFCFVEERANKEEVNVTRAKDKARAKLVEISENHDLMVLIGQFLEGDKYKAGMSDDTLYKMLSNYIEDKKDSDNIKRFVKAVSTPIEDLQFKIVVDRAIKKKIIRYDAKSGLYQRGQVTLGKTPMDVYSNLRSPEYATEFLSIQNDME